MKFRKGDLMLKLYENIKKYRKALGLTQTELAELVGYTDGSMITKIESGKVDLSRNKVYDFAEALETTAAKLMGLDEEIKKEANKMSDINDIFVRQLKYYLDLRNKSQTELAEYIGVAKSTITNYVNGINMPRMDKIDKICQFLMIKRSDLLEDHSNDKRPRGVRIPVLGRVAAGIPIDAIEEIIDYEEISEEEARQGEYFGLQIKGDSMYPRILDGDVVIVRKQNYANNSDVVIVLINGNEGTCKQFYKYDDHVELKPFNLMYKPLIFNKEEVIKLPVRIIGKVVELRGKF